MSRFWSYVRIAIFTAIILFVWFAWLRPRVMQP